MQTRETSISSARVTGRSLLLGVLFIPVNVYWMTLVEVKYYSLDGSCLPLFIQPVFIMFVCVVANTVLKRLAPRQMLQQGRVAYCLHHGGDLLYLCGTRHDAEYVRKYRACLPIRDGGE